MSSRRLPQVFGVAVVLSAFALAACEGSPSGTGSRVHSGQPGYPVVRITNVIIPFGGPPVLTIQFELANSGTTTTALSQSQFSFVSFTADGPPEFSGQLAFPPDAPSVFTLRPSERISLSATTQHDRFSGKSWVALIGRESTVRINVNSGKSQEFPNQWLGQTHSDNYELVRTDTK